MSMPMITLNNGYNMPGIGLGTYNATGELFETIVKTAIDVGYRHIDTGAYYENEEEIGNAIKEKIEDSTITRDDVFVTTKVWGNCHKEESVVKSCKESLQRLGLKYVDLYLIHWPVAFLEGPDLIPLNERNEVITTDVDYIETWRGMEECFRQGYARSIGISNFNSEQISRLLKSAKIKPVNNQIEVNINVNQIRLIEFCKERDIAITSYSPLGQPGNRHNLDNQFENPKLREIGKKHNKTSAQVALRFVLQLGATPLPKTTNKARLKENFDIFNFNLTEEEMNTIKSLETGRRVGGFEEIQNHKFYPYNIPF